MSATSLRVSICLVTHNSAGNIAKCLDAICSLDHPDLEVIVVDCASRDRTIATIEDRPSTRIPVHVEVLRDNRGFAGGMNRALDLTAAPWVLSLNPDTVPAPSFVSRLLERATSRPDSRVGAVTGRLIRLDSSLENPTLDACGMELRPSWRHFDRGSGVADQGQWMRPNRVFGATGAASLFNRSALNDVAIEGEVFAAEFHSFREDAELCFRLRERDWEILYEPTADCRHRRRSLPQRRRQVPPEVNYHSLKNRYLLRAYHQDAQNVLLTLIPTLWRDVMAFLYVLALERGSLAAYSWLWRHRSEILAKRRTLMSRRLLSGWALNRWFFTRGRPL